MTLILTSLTVVLRWDVVISDIDFNQLNGGFEMRCRCTDRDVEIDDRVNVVCFFLLFCLFICLVFFLQTDGCYQTTMRPNEWMNEWLKAWMNEILWVSWCFSVLGTLFPQYLRNAWWTHGRTDQQTDGWTDKASYRDIVDASKKSWIFLNLLDFAGFKKPVKWRKINIFQ